MYDVLPIQNPSFEYLSAISILSKIDYFKPEMHNFIIILLSLTINIRSSFERRESQYSGKSYLIMEADRQPSTY